jgi:hypothetical protein
MSGKNNDLPAGISQARTTGSVVVEPARNQTLSTWRWAQCSPVVSVSGLTAAGTPERPLPPFGGPAAVGLAFR